MKLVLPVLIQINRTTHMGSKKRIYILAFLMILGILSGCDVENNEVGRKQLFDLNWKYNQGENASAYHMDFNDQDWESTDLPHSWNKDLDSNSIIWYRKHFEIPQSWSNKSISIFFEGISYPHDLYINGVLIEDIQKEEIAIHVDLDSYIISKKNNVIAVRITKPHQQNNPSQPESGIFKHVWLVVKDNSNLKQ